MRQRRCAGIGEYPVAAKGIRSIPETNGNSPVISSARAAVHSVCVLQPPQEMISGVVELGVITV